MRCCSARSASCWDFIATAKCESEGKSMVRVWDGVSQSMKHLRAEPDGCRTCWRFPFLVISEKAMVFGGVAVPSFGLSSAAFPASRGTRRIGSGTSNICFLSNLRESMLSAINFASSLSNSASASGSCSSFWRVTTMSASKSESCLASPLGGTLTGCQRLLCCGQPGIITSASASSLDECASSISGTRGSSSSPPSDEASSSASSASTVFSGSWLL